MRRNAIVFAISALVALGPVGVAQADDYFGQDAPKEEISFRMDVPRTTGQRIVIASLLGGAVLFGGVGLGFHLDSRSKSDELSANEHTHLIYDAGRDDTRKSALRSRTVAIVGYSVGGALALASAVALYITEPGTKVVTVGNEKDDAAPPPAPVPVSELVSRVRVKFTRGGVVLGSRWRF